MLHADGARERSAAKARQQLTWGTLILAQQSRLENAAQQEKPGPDNVPIEVVMSDQVRELVGGVRYPHPRAAERDQPPSCQDGLGWQDVSRFQQFGVDLDDPDGAGTTPLRQVSVTRGVCRGIRHQVVANPPQTRGRWPYAFPRDQKVKVAHEAPARFRVQAIDQMDRTF